MALLDVRSLVKHYPVRVGLFSRRQAKAVDDVNLTVNHGETIGIVGESGSGKTTLARCILRMIEPTSGEVIFDGVDLLKLGQSSLRTKRRELAVVYQNPYLSLSPRLAVRDLVGEPLVTHTSLRGDALNDRVVENLEAVGLSADYLNKRSRQLSGGQAQRVAIARALVLRPKLIVLDEPTSALDVSVQAQVLNLLVKLRTELGFTYLFISHNLDVVQHLADRVAVMYLGKVVEVGTTDQVFSRASHPYTMALLAATPELHPDRKASLVTVQGSVPSLTAPPTGCHYHPRCQWAVERCRHEMPALRLDEDRRAVRCHFPREYFQASKKFE